MVEMLRRNDIDVLAVQETKCKDDQFPTAAFEELGYQVAHHGLNQWNGVAIISRVGLEDIQAAVSYTHLTLPTTQQLCRSRWSPYH